MQHSKTSSSREARAGSITRDRQTMIQFVRNGKGHVRQRDAVWHRLINTSNSTAEWDELFGLMHERINDMRSGVLRHLDEKRPKDGRVKGLARKVLPKARSAVYRAKDDLSAPAMKLVLSSSGITGTSAVPDIEAWIEHFRSLPKRVILRIEELYPGGQYFDKPIGEYERREEVKAMRKK